MIFWALGFEVLKRILSTAWAIYVLIRRNGIFNANEQKKTVFSLVLSNFEMKIDHLSRLSGSMHVKTRKWCAKAHLNSVKHITILRATRNIPLRLSLYVGNKPNIFRGILWVWQIHNLCFVQKMANLFRIDTIHFAWMYHKLVESWRPVQRNRFCVFFLLKLFILICVLMCEHDVIFWISNA